MAHKNSLKNLEKGAKFRFTKGHVSKNKGKTLEEIYGVEKASKIKEKYSLSHIGIKTGRITFRGGFRGKHSEKTKNMLREHSKMQFRNGMPEETKEKIRDHHKLEKILVGEKHWNWKGGISKLRDRLKHSLEYSKWRLAVYTRDGFTCQNCKHIGENLNAHHIKPFALILKENNIKTYEDALKCQELWNVNNGVTLCFECHEQTESYLNNKIALVT